jgi:hypothetical protein
MFVILSTGEADTGDHGSRMAYENLARPVFKNKIKNKRTQVGELLALIDL